MPPKLRKGGMPRVLLLFLILTLHSNRAPAALDPTSFVGVTNDDISNLGAFVALGADLHAYESARPYSSSYGMDFGATVTMIQLPGSVTKALTDVGVPRVPHYVPLPKVNIQKGIGSRLLFGSEFIPSVKVGGNKVSIYGFNLQWVVIDRPRLPPIAIRTQYNYSSLVFVSAATFGGDILINWDLAIVGAYGGAGYRYYRASIANPTGINPRIIGVDLNTSGDAGHFFAGAVVRLGPSRVTAEANLTTRGVNTYGTKLSFFF